MGTWEGHFAIRTATGEDLVPEIFFFYSLSGEDVPDNLRCLPQEPIFSFTALKSECIKKSKHMSIEGMRFDLRQKAKLNGNVNKLEEQLEGINDYTLLVGFGRNPYGRFSLIASLEESTGTLYCEKRYMVSKEINHKRTRRTNSEIAAAASSERDVDANGLRHISTRPRHAPNFGSHRADCDNFAVSAHRKRKGLAVCHTSKLSRSSISSADALESFALGETKPVKAVAKSKERLDNYDIENYRTAFTDEETGEIYEGEWFSGRRNGFGVCLYPDGTMLEGKWVNGKAVGKGSLMTDSRKVIYTGDWLDGLMHGYGVFNFINGDIYSGDWREGNRQGQGEYKFKNGCVYVGDWKDNKRHGKGVFSWSDFSVYDGEWEGDSRHGKGVLELNNGFKYDGYWSNNYMDGRGTSIFPDGQEYRGTFKFGLRDGRGSIKFSDGAVYEGRFRDDRIDGHGIIKITEIVPGIEDNELFIPIEIQADIRRIHLKAGF